MAHISHLIEDRTITLGTIREIVRAAADGKLPNATEKLDGVNIVFTCSPKYEVRFARSDSDIKVGGMVAAVLDAKYTGRGLVQETFAKGAAAIRAAVRAFSPSELQKAFDNGRLWYSAEIVYTKNPNVVRYAEDGIVLHERPVLRCDDSVMITLERNVPFNTFERAVSDMDDLTKALGWRFHGPQRLAVQPQDLDEHVNAVEKALQALGRDDMTLQECLNKRAELFLLVWGVRESVLSTAAKRLAEASGAPSLTVLKKTLSEGTINRIRKSDEWVANELMELDHAIQRFSSCLLASASSSLVADNAAESSRINDELLRCVGRVHTSHNPAAVAILEAQLARFGGDVRVTTPVEGVVFTWGDKIYKLTGAFAPANAIMGLVKYGRGKAVPPLGG